LLSGPDVAVVVSFGSRMDDVRRHSRRRGDR
jgi:hypothetical protein